MDVEVEVGGGSRMWRWEVHVGRRRWVEKGEVELGCGGGKWKRGIEVVVDVAEGGGGRWRLEVACGR